MPIDPQVQAFLDELAALGVPPLHSLSPEEARRVAAADAHALGPPEPMAKVEDRVVPGPGGEIPVRVYTPRATGRSPVLVYFHGGGWVLGSILTHDATCREIANAAGCTVVSVEYRLAPEHK